MTCPSIEELQRFNSQQLKAVKDFEIQNEHGKLEFYGLTDLNGVDF